MENVLLEQSQVRILVQRALPVARFLDLLSPELKFNSQTGQQFNELKLFSNPLVSLVRRFWGFFCLFLCIFILKENST